MLSPFPREKGDHDRDSSLLPAEPPAYWAAVYDAPGYTRPDIAGAPALSYTLFASDVSSSTEAAAEGSGTAGSQGQGQGQGQGPAAVATSPSSPTLWSGPSGLPWNGTEVRIYDGVEGRLRYTVRIPAKREGWKAEVSAVEIDDESSANGMSITHASGKHAALHVAPPTVWNTPRYLLRREPLARRVDFWHQPEGSHNVMIPSSRPALGPPREYTFEAPDGQSLVWQRSQMISQRSAHPFRASWVLLSLPSRVVVAIYMPQPPLSPSTPLPGPAKSCTLHERQWGLCSCCEREFMQGRLNLTDFQDFYDNHHDEAIDDTNTTPSRETKRSTIATDEEHGRLAKAHKHMLGLGLAVPGILAAAAIAPLSAASWNKQCILGDDLANLGRTQVGVAEAAPNAASLPGIAPFNAASSGETAERLAELNRSGSSKKRDKKPRPVDLDFLVASLVAALDA